MRKLPRLRVRSLLTLRKTPMPLPMRLSNRKESKPSQTVRLKLRRSLPARLLKRKRMLKNMLTDWRLNL